MSDAGLKILIVDLSALRASVLEEGLREAGHVHVVILRDTQNLLRPGILMKQRRCTEEDAYALMRKTAMNENMCLGEVAQSIVTAAAHLLGPTAVASISRDIPPDDPAGSIDEDFFDHRGVELK